MYIFIIDTDMYAGNFERELTAYCTGVIGDCGVGQERAKLFVKECPEQENEMAELVEQVADEHGCYRPTKIQPTPGFFNDGMGNEWPDSEWPEDGVPSAKVIETYKKTWDDHINEYGGPAKYKEINRTIPSEKEKSTPGRFPSYQSVGIFLNKNPTKKQLKFLMNRAEKYKPLTDMPWDVAFNIRGFRLVKISRKTNEIWSEKVK